MLAVIDEVTEEFLRRSTRVFSTRVQASLRVCSFSEVSDSVLMWSHYAKMHEGLCMEYDIEALPRGDLRRRFLFPVIYNDGLFDGTPHLLARLRTGRLNTLVALLSCLHKAPDWEYEREWRFVLPFGEAMPEGPYHMPKPSRVLIGARVRSQNVRVVSRTARDRGIPVVRMRLSERQLRLEEGE